MSRRTVLSAAVPAGAAGARSAGGQRASAATVLNVKDFGAAGDGTTVDNAAINSAVAAAAAGDEIFFPVGVYAVNSQLRFSKSLTFQGSDATIKKVGATLPSHLLVVDADDFHVQDLGFDDSSNLVNGFFLNFRSGFSGGQVRRCIFHAPRRRAVQFTNHTDGVFNNNTITAAGTAVQLTGSCSHMTVNGNDIGNWRVRGIHVAGTADGVTSNLTINGNTIHDLAAGGSVRQPIAIVRGVATSNFSHVQVSNNTVIGPDKSWTADDPGTADQISLAHCTDFEVFGNHSRRGGDIGTTITRTSQQGVVRDNVCDFNDVAGIVVAASSHDIELRNNECMNNGQNRDGNRSDTGRAGVKVIGNSSDVIVTGNTLGDDQAVKTQNYGASILNSSNITLGPDTDAGNKIALYFEDP